MRHQTETAISGMWLFLATEVLFFGGLFLLYAVYRFTDPAGIAEGSRHAELLIGTINTVLLNCSAVFAWGAGARAGAQSPTLPRGSAHRAAGHCISRAQGMGMEAGL